MNIVFYVIFWTHRDRLENHEYVASNRDKQFEKLKFRVRNDEKIELENQKLVSRFDFLTLMCKKDHRMCLLFISRNFLVDLNFVVCAR